MARFAAPIRPVSLLLAGLIVSALALVARGESPRELQGKIVSPRAWSQDLPIAGARVRLEDSSGEAVSDGNGLYQLPLPPGVKPGDAVTVSVSASGYVLYEPAGGRAKVPPDPLPRATAAELEWSRLTVRLLPKGSATLLEDPQLEALIADLSGIHFKAGDFKDALVDPEEEGEDAAAPFDLALRDWAASAGLPYEKVDRRVRAWSEESFAHRGGGSPARLGEAAFGARHYEEAGAIWASAAAESRQEYARRHSSPVVEEAAKALAERLPLYTRSAAARDSARLFEEARQVALEATQDAQAELHRFPQDPQLRRLGWGSSLVSAYHRLRYIQEAALPQERQSAASGLLGECRGLRAQIPRDSEPRLWAWSTLLVATVTGYLGEVSRGKPALDALDQAVADATSAAAFYGKDNDPASWAVAQTLAGRLLQAKAGQSLSDDSQPPAVGQQLLSQSRAALLPVLEVYSQDDHPRQWGEIRRLLARSAYLGARADPAQLPAAQAQIRTALSATPPEIYPEAWADMQELLGEAQETGARSVQGAGAASLWRAAVKAFSLAAGHRVREHEPLRWAGSEEQLAGALEGAAGAVESNEAGVFLERAVEAYRATLSVLDREHSAAQWERVQAGLARVLVQKAAHEEAGKHPPKTGAHLRPSAVSSAEPLPGL